MALTCKPGFGVVTDSRSNLTTWVFFSSAVFLILTNSVCTSVSASASSFWFEPANSSSNFFNSAAFLALYASISAWASVLAAFNFWARSARRTGRGGAGVVLVSVQCASESVRLVYVHCLALDTISCASFSVLSKLWIPDWRSGVAAARPGGQRPSGGG